MAGSSLKFKAVPMGMTPDKEWAWYAITSDDYHGGNVIGVIAESPALTYFGTDETYRRYNIIFYEPSVYGEGTMPMTTARSLEQAVEIVIDVWDNWNQIARRAKASREADCTDSEIRGN